ncbi:MAG: pirin family protein [Betaproteobacteria bacterium]|nr:pirin family protein [Betaproteobacteria bacterium]
MPISQLLKPHTKSLSPGFDVRRLLPAGLRQSVGPFLFFDHFGPVAAGPADNHDVRPHPHIGLATVTYLFEGAMMHRDSLSVVQRIEPGAINWMTAGSGIVHSERTPEDLRGQTRRSHGLQLWVALPKPFEEVDASFAHTPADALPVWQQDGATVRVLIGQLAGLRSPVVTFSKTLYLDVTADSGAAFTLPDMTGSGITERAVYSLEQQLEIDGELLAPHTMAMLAPEEAKIKAPAGARYVVIGGEPLDGHRFIWWNFVSSSRERIGLAKQAWADQAMGTVPGETEFIPLPEK